MENIIINESIVDNLINNKKVNCSTNIIEFVKKLEILLSNEKGLAHGKVREYWLRRGPRLFSGSILIVCLTISCGELFKKNGHYVSYIINRKIGFKKIDVKMILLEDYLVEKNINKIDLLKIDTEGYEYETLLGLRIKLKNVKLILFEHHYDYMFLKNY